MNTPSVTFIFITVFSGYLFILGTAYTVTFEVSNITDIAEIFGASLGSVNSSTAETYSVMFSPQFNTTLYTLARKATNAAPDEMVYSSSYYIYNPWNNQLNMYDAYGNSFDCTLKPVSGNTFQYLCDNSKLSLSIRNDFPNSVAVNPPATNTMWGCSVAAPGFCQVFSGEYGSMNFFGSNPNLSWVGRDYSAVTGGVNCDMWAFSMETEEFIWNMSNTYHCTCSKYFYSQNAGEVKIGYDCCGEHQWVVTIVY